MMMRRVTEPTSSEPSAPPAPSRWRRRAAIAAAVVALSPVAFFFFATFVLRHRPWSVPEAWRAPAPPAVGSTGGLWVRYLGVTGYEVTDGTTTLLLDPTFTRPAGAELLRPLEVDADLVAKNVTRADFVLV